MAPALLDLELDTEALLAQAADQALPEALPEIPAWMVQDDQLAPLPEPPSCGCCGRDEHVWDEPAPVPVTSPGEDRQGFWTVPGVTGLDQPALPVLPSVGELVTRAVSVVEQLAALDPSALEAGRALGEAEALTGLQHTLRSLMLTRVKDVGDRELYEHLGYRSLASWQRDTAPDTPRSERTLSRRLGTLPWLRDALRSRQVSFTAANKVGTALADLRAHLDRPDGLIDNRPAEDVLAGVISGTLDLLCQHYCGLSTDGELHPDQAALLQRLDEQLGRIAASPTSQLDRIEQLLVLVAVQLPAAELPAALEHITLCLLPETLEGRERAARRQRALSLKPNKDGTWDLHATLTPEVGEQLFTALSAEARRDPANPLDTHAREAARHAAAAQGAVEPTVEPTEPATPAEPVVDPAAPPVPFAEFTGEHAEDFDEVSSGLLVETDPWAARPLGSADPEPLHPRGRGQRLHDALGLCLTRYLTAGLGGTRNKVPVQISALITDRLIEGAPGAPPARGGSGRPLARSTVRRWWCDAHVTVLLMSKGWTPLGVVHQQRNVTGVEMKALQAQFDQRCPGIGCCTGQPNPLTPLVPHHVDLYSETGTTQLSRIIPACEVLHQDIHLGKRTIRLRDGSYISEDGYLHDPG